MNRFSQIQASIQVSKRSYYKAFLLGLGLFYSSAILTTPLFSYSLYIGKTVQVPGQNIRLSEIGRLRGKDATVHSPQIFLAELKEPRYFPAAEIQKKLRPPPRQIYGTGIWLIPRNRRLSTQELNALLAEQLDDLEGSQQYLKNLRFYIKKGMTVALPLTGVKLRYSLPGHASAFKPGQRILPLYMYTTSQKKGQALLRFQIPVAIKRKLRLAVARRALPIAHRLSAKDFSWEERIIDDENIRYAQSPLLNHRVMTMIKNGQALTTSNVQAMPTVLRGQRLRLVYQKNGVVIRCQAIAARSGYMGEEIPVQLVLPKTKHRRLRPARILSEQFAELVPEI